jgi:hypothetical protein
VKDEGAAAARSPALETRSEAGSFRSWLREATATFRRGGLRGVVQAYGWRLFAAFFVFYLVRDVTLYILLPYLAARGLLSLWR